MLFATHANSRLHSAYEELGQLACQAIKKGELQWEDSQVLNLLQTIADCQDHLKHYEEEVCHLKEKTGS